MAGKKEFSRESVEAFRRYLKKADFYALAFKFGDSRHVHPHVEYKLFTGEGVWNLFKNPETRILFSECKGCVKFNVRDMMRGQWKAIDRKKAFADAIASFDFSGVYEDVFPSDSNDRSRAQENKLAARLEADGYMGQHWRAVGHEKISAHRYYPDIVGTDGTVIEVKGDNSDLRISFESNAAAFNFDD